MGELEVSADCKPPGLSRDNALLSRDTDANVRARARAVDCTEALAEQVAGYVADSLAANTKRAYVSDLAHFVRWGGSVPSGDTFIGSYLAAHAGNPQRGHFGPPTVVNL